MKRLFRLAQSPIVAVRRMNIMPDAVHAQSPEQSASSVAIPRSLNKREESREN
jgi:hypothetical protein